MRIPFRKSEAPKPKRRKRTYIATTKGNEFPYAIVELAKLQKAQINGQDSKTDIEKDSQQEGEQSSLVSSQKLASKPYDPALFYWMYNNSVYVRRCVDQIASDVAGTGYTIKQKEEKPASAQEEDKINALMENPNDEYSIEDLWQMFLIDRNLIGYAGIEVARDLEGTVNGLWHMNAERIWVHKDKKTGLFAEKNSFGVKKEKWFVRFGMTDDNGKLLQVHKETGKAGDVEFKDRAHEIIYNKIYYPLSSYYGAPPITPASGDVVVGVGARDYNISFFINYGVPSMLIMLSGEWQDDVDPDEETLVEIMNRELKGIKGAENNHGSIVIQTPEGCEMTVEQLNVGVKEGSFRLIKADVSQDVMVAYGMPPYRIGLAKTGSLAGNVADEMLRTYISGVVEPGQIMIEKIMNNLFVKGLGIENYELKLRDVELWDEKAQAEIAAMLIRTGQNTPNQIRRERGESEYIGGDTYYMESNLLGIGDDDTE